MIALFTRDIRLAVRAGGGFGLGLAFFLIVVVLVPFAVGPEVALLSKIAPGILWIGALLACLLSLDRIFALDREDGSLDLLATSPLPLEGVCAVKALAHWVTTGLPLVVAAPVLGVLMSLPTPGYLWLVVSLLLGTPALSAIGTFGAALTVGIKRGGLLLSLLVLPLYVPTLNDPAVVYASGFDVDGFNTLITEQGVARGEIMDVNSLSGRWNQRWDFRFQQDLPGIPGADRWVGDNRLKLVFDVENVMNLLNDEWGTYSSSVGFGQAQIVSADLVSAADVALNGVDGATALRGDAPRTTCLSAGDCVYRFNSFNSFRGDTDNPSASRSVWAARIGIRYEF